MKSNNKIEINIDLYSNPITPKKNVVYAKIANPKGKENMKPSISGSFIPINFKIFCPNAIEINSAKIK